MECLRLDIRYAYAIQASGRVGGLLVPLSRANVTNAISKMAVTSVPLDRRWQFFTRQSAALECADSSPSEAQVWSVEHEGGAGKRSYIVASREGIH